MKYYLVNYIILNNKTVTENQKIGITLYTFASIEDFKRSIAEVKKGGVHIDHIVIKSYEQISKEAYDLLNTAMV